MCYLKGGGFATFEIIYDFHLVVLIQHFQKLTGSLRSEGRMIAVTGRVEGENFSFKAGGREYRGRLNGNSLDLR